MKIHPAIAAIAMGLTLAAEFSDLAAAATPTAQPTNIIPQNRSAAAIPWLMGLSFAGAIVASVIKRRQWSAKAEL